MSIAQLVHLRCQQSPKNRLLETSRFLKTSRKINPVATQAFYKESLNILRLDTKHPSRPPAKTQSP